MCKLRVSRLEQSRCDRVAIPRTYQQAVITGILALYALLWLSSFLRDRQQCVWLNGCQSSVQSPKSGIPQGTVLGPVLFLVFITTIHGRYVFHLHRWHHRIYHGERPSTNLSRSLSGPQFSLGLGLAMGMLFSAEKKSERLHIRQSSRKTLTLSPGVSLGRTCVL